MNIWIINDKVSLNDVKSKYFDYTPYKGSQATSFYSHADLIGTPVFCFASCLVYTVYVHVILRCVCRFNVN